MNVVIRNEFVQDQDQDLIFGDEPVIDVWEIPRDLPGLLVQLGVFKSTGEARRAGRTGPIPEGYNEIRASRKVHLYLWNPTE